MCISIHFIVNETIFLKVQQPIFFLDDCPYPTVSLRYSSLTRLLRLGKTRISMVFTSVVLARGTLLLPLKLSSQLGYITARGMLDPLKILSVSLTPLIMEIDS